MDIFVVNGVDFRPPVLPDGVAECEGFGHSSWVSKRVTLLNKAGNDIARGVCQSVDSHVVPETGGRPLGSDFVCVQIAESLEETEIPFGWIYSLHAWRIKRIMLNGASLYDHDQRAIYNAVVKAFGRPARIGVRQYDSTRQRRPRDSPSKKEYFLLADSINYVATTTCCSKNCVQPFPRGKIKDLRTQFYVTEDVFFRKHRMLDGHGQVHEDANGNEMVTLEGIEVCCTAWYLIVGVSRALFYRWRSAYRDGAQAEHHGNRGAKKPRIHTLQATATLISIVENAVDLIPHRSKTIHTGEKVVSKCLPSSYRWRDALPELNAVNALHGLPAISPSSLSRIRQESFPEYYAKPKGDTFSRCGECDKIKQLRSSCVPGSRAWTLHDARFKRHNASQMAHRLLYYSNQTESEARPEASLCVIHDKMDHSKTASPQFSHKSKSTDSFMKLFVSTTGMIAHGHGDVRYAHFGLDIYPTDSNHTVGSFAQLLRDLESPPKFSSRELFFGGRTSPLSKAVLDGADICLDSLGLVPDAPIPAKSLPPVLHMQLDNACGDNKNRFVFAFFSLLVYKGVFREVFLNFLIMGHTHEDIDALFGRSSNKLKSKSFPTVPLLMKSFMDTEEKPVIPHLIEEVLDFKKFIEGYLCDGKEELLGHASAQQFRFFTDASGCPLMQYKILCTDAEWLPQDSAGIKSWKVKPTEEPKVSLGDPTLLVPNKMRNIEEIRKGISGFVSMWESLADADPTGDYRRQHEEFIYYWKSVCEALDLPIPTPTAFRNGFWPTLRYSPSEEDQFEDNGELREEFADDPPFVGQRQDRPQSSFRVMRDCYEGYFVVLRPDDDDDLKKIWIAHALSNPNSSVENPLSILLEYWRPVSYKHVNPDTYEGWDTKRGNSWMKDTRYEPTWMATNSIMGAWKPKFRPETVNLKASIPELQMRIIKASLEEYPE